MSGKDTSYDRPRIALQATMSKQGEGQDYHVDFLLSRRPDDHDEPCMIKFDLSDFFRHDVTLQGESSDTSKDKNFQRDDLSFVNIIQGPIKVEASGEITGSIYELQSGATAKFRLPIPYHYIGRVRTGSYRLSWPDIQIEYWNWGSLAENEGAELNPRKPDDTVILLGDTGPVFDHVQLTFAEEREDRRRPEGSIFGQGRNKYHFELWDYYKRYYGIKRAKAEGPKWWKEQIGRARAMADGSFRSEPSEAGAPVFSVKLEACPDLFRNKVFEIGMHVTLDKEANAKAVAFHSYRLGFYGFEVVRRIKDDEKDETGAEWYLCPDDTLDCGGFILTDEPDVCVNVTQHEHFTVLQSGETLTRTFQEHHPHESRLPMDTVVGDEFRVCFTGLGVDWWDWGDAEDHAQTEVWLPCCIRGDVTNLRDNEGRPKLRMPAATSASFYIRS